MSRYYVLLLCFILAFAPIVARADAPLTIAVVDVQALMTQSDAAKSLEKQVSDRKEKFIASLSKQEQDLRDAQKKLTDARATMSKDAFAKKAQEFEKKLMDTRQMAQDTKKTYDDALEKALNQLRAKIYEVVQGIAKEKSYTLVISKQEVVVGQSSMDITDDAMKKLNATITTLNLDIKDK